MTPRQALKPKANILLINDDANTLKSLSATLRIAGYRNVVTLEDSRLAMNSLEQDNYFCILLDLMMPHIPGEVLLPSILERFPGIPVIVFSAMCELETVVSCMRAGAHNYLTKMPWKVGHFVRTCIIALVPIASIFHLYGNV